jgi:quercetin dioxygenase-like cupin family protein
MPNQRFITPADAKVEELPWGSLDWMCRPDMVAAEQLQLVHVRIPPGQGHAFHRHPEMEEIIYVLEGACEQWVEREKRILGPGDVVHIPINTVHCSYNVGDSTLRVLAILSPAKISGPAMVDVSQDEPWKSLRR